MQWAAFRHGSPTRAGSARPHVGRRASDAPRPASGSPPAQVVGDGVRGRLTERHEDGHERAVNYDELKATFLAALKESGLPAIGATPSEEILDLRSMDRTLTVYVEPMGREM